MRKNDDQIKNMSGERNMMAPTEWRPCGVTSLIDGFIADGWISKEDRFKEIAAIYKGNAKKFWEEVVNGRDVYERRSYSAGWIDRWIEDTTVRNN